VKLKAQGHDRYQADNWINSSYLLTYTVGGRNDEKNPKDVRDGENRECFDRESLNLA